MKFFRYLFFLRLGIDKNNKLYYNLHSAIKSWLEVVEKKYLTKKKICDIINSLWKKVKRKRKFFK